MHRVEIVLALLLLGFAVAHSLEDFAYDIPEERFGVETTTAAVLGGIGFAAQALVLLLAARARLVGHAGHVVVGAGWFLAAVLDHLGEILTAEDYRAGLPSKALEVGLIVSAALLAIAALVTLREAFRSRRQ